VEVCADISREGCDSTVGGCAGVPILAVDAAGLDNFKGEDGRGSHLHVAVAWYFGCATRAGKDRCCRKLAMSMSSR
jgi:hypothetical protein